MAKSPIQLGRNGKIVLYVVLIAMFVALGVARNQSHKAKLDDAKNLREEISSVSTFNPEDIEGSWSLHKNVLIEGFDDIVVIGKVNFLPGGKLQGKVSARAVRDAKSALDWEDIEIDFTGTWKELKMVGDPDHWIKANKLKSKITSRTGSGLASDQYTAASKREAQMIAETAVIANKLRVVRMKMELSV
jgi:hypothetical protein